jgi:hypothetical protein
MAVTMRQKPPRAILGKVRKLAQIARELSEGASFSITHAGIGAAGHGHRGFLV